MPTYSKILTNNKVLSLDYGTRGIRGKFDVFPVTIQAFFCLGRALGQICNQALLPCPGQVLILNDGRDSTDQLFSALSAGLVAEGAKPINCGLLPTPAAPILLDYFKDSALAIVLTASHNSFEFNGIKIFSRTDDFLVNYGFTINKIFNFFYQDFSDAIDLEGKVEDCSLQARKFYVDNFLKLFNPLDFKSQFKILLDCANGAASSVAEEIARSLGISIKLINFQPDGRNINFKSGSTYPQTLVKAMSELDCDIGFAFDGDADRVICVNKSGQIKDGDDFLAILARSERFFNAKRIVGTVMSNSGLEAYLGKFGKTLLRSEVGEVSIKRLMVSTDSDLGGEPSGHFLIGREARSSDGIKNMLEIFKAALLTNNLELSTFKKFFSKLIAIPVTTKLSLDCGPIFELSKKFEQQIGQGRVFLRYSQTEPILRILVETQDQSKGLDVSSKIETEVYKIFKNV